MRDLINKVAPTLYLYSDREDRDNIMRDGIAADEVVITTKLVHDNRDVWEIDLSHDFTLDHIPAECLNLLSERIMESVDSRREASPSHLAKKFWITDKGEINYLDKGQHHLDVVDNWGGVFDQGWVRGFYEPKSDLLCLDFDQRHLKIRTKRAILKLIKEYRPETCVWDETRHGAFYSSEKMSTREFISDLRYMGEVLSEAPIADISHLGDWEKSSSYRDPRDRKLLTSVKALNKIKTMWKYPTEVDFNIILINNAEANRHTELGMIDRKTIPDLFPVSADSIEALLRDDQVNIIFTNNKGAERVPMTGWILAHRFGHALYAGRGRSFYMKEALATFNRYLGDILKEYNIRPTDSREPLMTNGPVTRFLEHLCIFRSAREKNLRSSFEAFYELFAQYIMRGAITFNPLPKSFKFGSSTYIYSRPDDDYEYDNSTMEEMGDEMRQYFETAIHYAVGKVLVM